MSKGSGSLPPPAWVYKRDGRLVPFDPDKISGALFAVTESLGRPDAFIARELTDGIVHFLAAEANGPVQTTTQIADLVVKVVRELGQPVLAQAFQDCAQTRRVHSELKTEDRGSKIYRATPGPAAIQAPGSLTLDPQSLAWQMSGACGRDFCLREVFSRDVVAAQAEGLLVLGGLEAPRELEASIINISTGGRFVEAVEESRGFAGVLLAVDSPEYVLSAWPPAAGSALYSRELAIGLRATGLHAVVNLNSFAPPPWADDLAAGPLFAESRQPFQPERLSECANDLLEQLLMIHGVGERTRIDWHLGERDFAGHRGTILLCLARRALEGASLAFAFERPRRPVPLAEGLDRRHRAVLLTVGLDLPRLAQQLGPQTAPAVFLQKLQSLARLGLSAGVQKRDFLRRQGRSQPTFLLDRARLVAVPIGLDAIARQVASGGLCTSGPGLEFARKIVERLREVLENDGLVCHLETCLDSAADFCMAQSAQGPAQAAVCPQARQAAGLTSWDPNATAREQLRGASALQAVADAGTAAVLWTPDHAPTPEDVVDWLRFAWRQTHINRLRIFRISQPERQLMAPWEETATG